MAGLVGIDPVLRFGQGWSRRSPVRLVEHPLSSIQIHHMALKPHDCPFLFCYFVYFCNYNCQFDYQFRSRGRREYVGAPEKQILAAGHLT